MNYPNFAEIRLWSDPCLLDCYEEELGSDKEMADVRDLDEWWLYKARMRSEILRRMRVRL